MHQKNGRARSEKRERERGGRMVLGGEGDWKKKEERGGRR